MAPRAAEALVKVAKAVGGAGERRVAVALVAAATATAEWVVAA